MTSNGAQDLAALMVQMEYPRDEIAAAIAKDYPDADADALIDAEQQRKDKIDRELADAQASNEHNDRG